MKKRYVILAGVLALSLAAAGCGKEKETQKEAPSVTVTPTPEAAGDDLVDMQQSKEEEISNTMGEKTADAAKVVFTNKTGGEVAAIYIRPNNESNDDDEWGEDLVQERFVLKNGDKVIYYLDKSLKDEDGKEVSLYDIRISYVEEGRNECFFREIPLKTIQEISLCMDGTGEDGIPYATYKSAGSKKEVSTLSAVKKRLGLLEEEDSSDEDDTTQDQEKDENGETQTTPSPTQAPEPTVEPEEPEEPSDPVAQAEQYIGRPLSELIADCGDPTGQDYEDEPETGKTGYHYYPTFTVSTTVDENGNEIVAGVW